MRKSRTVASLTCSLAFLLPLASRTQSGPQKHNANLTAFSPFRIAGNLYYVGSEDQSSYLLATPKGLILINSGYEQSVPLIKQSVEKLGFRFSDVKILLISHAHIDHDAGSAAILQQTGARYEVMQPDVSVVESGGKTDFQNGSIPSEWYPPAHADRVLQDLDKVELGGTVLMAHLTPGHTKGCTTWTFDETEGGRRLHVLLLCGVAASAGPNRSYKLIDNPSYPNVVADFKRTFAVLPRLPCDIFLGAHGRYFGLQAKYARFEAGDKDAFIDPVGYKAYVAAAQGQFEEELKKQESGPIRPSS